MTTSAEQSRNIPEISLSDAAHILGIDRRTVKTLIAEGVLRVRIAGSSHSKRPRYRIPEADVLDYRNRYTRKTTNSGGVRRRKAINNLTSQSLNHIRLEE